MTIYHLDDCQIFLPPQILLYLRTKCGQPIIQVHQDMDGCVHMSPEERCKRDKCTFSPFHMSGRLSAHLHIQSVILIDLLYENTCNIAHVMNQTVCISHLCSTEKCSICFCNDLRGFSIPVCGACVFNTYTVHRRPI